MKALIIALTLLCAGSALAITAGEVSAIGDELMVLMDKYTWDSYIDDYLDIEVEVTPEIRATIKAQAIAKYNEYRAAMLQYATELGIIQ